MADIIHRISNQIGLVGRLISNGIADYTDGFMQKGELQSR